MLGGVGRHVVVKVHHSRKKVVDNLGHHHCRRMSGVSAVSPMTPSLQGHPGNSRLTSITKVSSDVLLGSRERNLIDPRVEGLKLLLVHTGRRLRTSRRTLVSCCLDARLSGYARIHLSIGLLLAHTACLPRRWLCVCARDGAARKRTVANNSRHNTRQLTYLN